MKYRAEIDGLRALAVIPVIFFHAGFEGFSGGFVGVDVFFVISGYLITTIIINEAEEGKFSLINFYERRARRILPALFFVVFACIPLAQIWLMPRDMNAFAESVFAIATFSSNFHFWLQSGYFDTAAELKPMLHTWSLAVEEQYYIIFPLLLMLTWRLGIRVVILMLALVFLLSFSAAQWGAYNDPAATFYLLPTRGWELLIGAFIAFYLQRKKIRLADRVQNVLSFSGLLMISLAVVAYDKSTPFPSFYALLPTVGTALIILFANKNTIANGLLNTRPLVGVGLISYSAYLWHQPLFAFARHKSLSEPSSLVLIALAVGSAILAYFTWRFIESPFRNGQLFVRSRIFLFLLFGSGILLLFGTLEQVTYKYISKNSPTHLPENYFSQIWNKHRPINGVDGRPCSFTKAIICKRSEEPNSRKILLVGDSHAVDYSTVFMDYAFENNLEAWQISMGGCAFIKHQYPRQNGECGKARRLIEKSVEEIEFSTIIFVSNMNAHIAQAGAEALDQNIESLSNLLNVFLKSGAKVYYFSPRPYFNYDPIKAAFLNRISEIEVVTNSSDEKLSKAIEDLSVVDEFTVIDQAESLVPFGCGKAECFNGHSQEMLPLYRDKNHFTTLGVKTAFSVFVIQSKLNQDIE